VPPKAGWLNNGRKKFLQFIENQSSVNRAEFVRLMCENMKLKAEIEKLHEEIKRLKEDKLSHRPPDEVHPI